MALFTQNTKVQSLREAPLFEGLSKKELTELARRSEDMELDAGTVLCREGDIGQEFFVIVEGTADVKKGSRRVNRLGPGDFFGEISLIRHTPRTATVVATSPVRTLVITERSFQGLLKHQPGIQNKVMSALAARLAPEEKI